MQTKEICISSETADEKLLFFDFEDEAFEFWTGGLENSSINALKSMLRKLFDLWNCRLSTSIGKSFVPDIARIFSIHGVPFICNSVDHHGSNSKNKVLVRNQRSDFNFKFIPSKNLVKFFEDISDYEYRCRNAAWINSRLLKPASLIVNTNSYIPHNLATARYQLYMASRNRNFRAVAANLAYIDEMRTITELLSKKTADRPMVVITVQKNIGVNGPFMMQSALHCVISTKRDFTVDIGNRLFHLAYHQTMLYTNRYLKNSILGQLSEFLTTALALGHTDAAEKIIFLDQQVRNCNKHREYLVPWKAYKLLVVYERWRQGEFRGAAIQSVADELAETLDYFDSSAESLTFVEASLRIRTAQSRNEEKVSELVSDVLQLVPQHARRVVMTLKSLNLEHEVESAIDEACSPLDTSLHSSDPIWLDWCQPRIERPHKFGIINEVLPRCLEIMFKFLDYGANRGNQRAWLMMWRLVQVVDKERFPLLWPERKSWWPLFHTVTLSNPAQQCRADVLQALQCEI